ncbi:type II secretion system F family protein [Streptomonospora sp. S1-112]|uniref:Type II secretion system F family protein n=1 Tax=Streptomonospora mangrovi TaxID=2883123 RepID=A0A9X3NMK6_9ACTN|nr:type II secretion system F family protein [Streptomonospora mangrovi]MDA0566497.1 type II secretion system F family protein [Streptomonospora mangrovi]
MTWVETAVVVLGTASAALLTGSSRPWARRRLRTLLPPMPVPRRRGRPRLRRAVLLWGVPCVPALTLLALVGPLGALLVGVPAGVALRWRLARGDGAVAPSVAGLPIAVDLLVAGLRAGGAMADVLAAVSDAIGGGPVGRAFGQAAEQVRLGADPGAAWCGAADGVGHPPEFGAVGRALARAARTGAPVADILERQAAEIRDSVRSRALARAQRLGVLAVAPLGLCFLPAFVLIGVVPLAAGLLTGIGTP